MPLDEYEFSLKKRAYFTKNLHWIVLSSLFISLAIVFALFKFEYDELNFWMTFFGIVPGWQSSVFLIALLPGLSPVRSVLLWQLFKAKSSRLIVVFVLLDLVFLYLSMLFTLHLCNLAWSGADQWLPDYLVLEPFPNFGVSLMFLLSSLPVLIGYLLRRKKTTPNSA